MSQVSRLPASFNSVYRLFLRVSSAAVMHHRKARSNLRARWRPVFDAGAKATKELQTNGSTSPPEWRQERIEWLKQWHARMDQTLALLCSSSTSRGLPHQVTRNLAYFIALRRATTRSRMKRAIVWNPKNPPPLIPKSKTATEIAKKLRVEQTAGQVDDAVEQALRMAEGSAGLFLGHNDIHLKVQRHP